MGSWRICKYQKSTTHLKLIAMIKMLIGLLILLAICAAVGIVRKMRGGTLLPPPTNGEKPDRPMNLADLHKQRKK